MDEQQLINPQKTIPLLEHWCYNTQRSQIANYDTAHRYEKYNNWLGWPIVILSALTSVSAFSSLAKLFPNLSEILNLATLILSSTITILVSIQKLFKFETKAAKHKESAALYGALKRDLQLVLASNFESPGIVSKIEKIKRDMDKLAKDYPKVPNYIWNNTREKVPTHAQRSCTPKDDH